MSLQQKLRKLIDEAAGQGNLQPIQEFMVLYPDIDFNAISPNGLSALWWALTPPIGKEINQDLVRLFLRHTNIVQTYQGYTPRQYLTFIDPIKFKQLIKDIENAEDQFVAQADNGNQQPGNLAAIANDSQNVHSSAVVKDTDESVKRLYVRYGAKLNTVVMLKEIRKHFFPLAHGHSLFPSQLENALNATEGDSTHREYTLEGGKQIKLNLSDLLCLAWFAANETDVTLLCGSTVSDADKNLRLEAISKALKDGFGYCWTGRSSRIVNALNAMHVDIRHEKKILDSEQSWNKYQAIISQELASLAENNKELFWLVMQENLSLIDGAKHTEAYIEILLNQQKIIETLASEMLDEKVTNQIDAQLKENTLHIQFFVPFQKLEALQVIFNKYKNTNFDEIIKNAKTESMNDLFNLLIEAFPYDEVIDELDEDEYIKKIDRSIKRRITQNAMHQYTKSKDKFDCIKSFFNMEYTVEFLASNYPAYTDWYKALSSELKKLFIGNISDFSDQNIFEFSVENNCLRHLKIANLDLSNTDMRGLDLSQVDFPHLKLDGADLRLSTLTNSTKLNLSKVILSEHLFHKLIQDIQNIVASTGQASDADIDYARLLLANRHLDFKKKDLTSINPLDRILGRNRFSYIPRSLLGGIFMPPITKLLSEPYLVANTSQADRCVDAIPLNENIQYFHYRNFTGTHFMNIFLFFVLAQPCILALLLGQINQLKLFNKMDDSSFLAAAFIEDFVSWILPLGVYFLVLKPAPSRHLKLLGLALLPLSILAGAAVGICFFILSVSNKQGNLYQDPNLSTPSFIIFLALLQLYNYSSHVCGAVGGNEFFVNIAARFFKPENGERYQSTYHHPFVYTGKTTERVKSSVLSVVSLFKCTQKADDQHRLLGPGNTNPNYHTIV